MIPTANSVLQEGDDPILMTAKESLDEVSERCAAKARTRYESGSGGAGKVGKSIARELAEIGHDVLLIDRDADLVERSGIEV